MADYVGKVAPWGQYTDWNSVAPGSLFRRFHNPTDFAEGLVITWPTPHASADFALAPINFIAIRNNFGITVLAQNHGTAAGTCNVKVYAGSVDAANLIFSQGSVVLGSLQSIALTFTWDPSLLPLDPTKPVPIIAVIESSDLFETNIFDNITQADVILPTTNSPLCFTSYCPVHLEVTGPGGKRIGPSINEIPGTLYIEDDFNGDQKQDHRIIVPDILSAGTWSVKVTKDSGAADSERYTLVAQHGGESTILADSVPVSNMPVEPYTYNSISAAGLLANYSLDGDARDASPNHLDGTIHNTRTIVGRSGYALSFDGATSYIDLGNVSRFGVNSFTVSIWAKPDGTKDYYARIFRYGSDHTTSWNGFGIEFNSPYWGTGEKAYGVLYYGVPYNSVCVIPSDSLPRGEWTHIAFTFDASSSSANFYVNGKLSGQGSGGYDAADGMVSLGQDGGGVHYYGALEDCRIYNRALSASEIQSLFIEPTTVEKTIGAIPTVFSLNQNYPNPFNPSSTIGFGLPQRLHATLTVFNSLGQKVATLVQGEQEAGYHEVRFDGSGLASGVYFYRLQAGTNVETKKLMLIR